jgi:hypothetical protein
MRTLLLIPTFCFFLAGTYAQNHRENQEITSLSFDYLSQSYHHVQDYKMTTPEMQFRQQIRWQDFLIQASTRHLTSEMTILRGGSLGLAYRPLIPYRDHWIEAGVFFSYDKQNPDISKSGKQSGWTGTMAVHRRLSDWYSHEIRSALGYYQGYVTDPLLQSQTNYVFPEMPREEFSYLRFDLKYDAEFQLDPISVGAGVNYRKSKFNSETLLSLMVKKNMILSAGQRLEFYGGVLLTGLNEAEKLMTEETFSETRFLLSDRTDIPLEELKPVQFIFGVKLAFLRGKKLRAF